MGHGTADLGRGLILAQALIDHLAEQVFIRPREEFNLSHQLGPNPMHAANNEW
jgi:hypothetical protein